MEYFTHDRIFRSSLARMEVAQDFIQAHLPSAYLNRIELNNLTLCPGSMIDSDLTEQQTDILYQTQTKEGKPCYIYFLLEHQSTPSNWLPFKIVCYQIAIMKNHLKLFKDETFLPIVFPIVYYQGPEGKPYPHSLKFFDLFADPDLAKATFATSAHLVDLSQLSDDELLKHKVICLLEFVHKYSRLPEVEFMARVPVLFQMIDNLVKLNLPEKMRDEYVSELFHYLLAGLNVTNRANFDAECEKNRFLKEKNIMPTYAELIRGEGIKEGIKKGILQGILQEKEKSMKKIMLEKEKSMKKMKLTASKLLKKGMLAKDIAECTGLSLKEVKDLKNQTRK